MSYVLVRPALNEEYEKIAKVFILSFNIKTTDQADLEKIIQRIKIIIDEGLTSFSIAEENGEIIGIGGETRYIGSSYIGYIGVIPSRRRLGIGSMIFERILVEASKSNPTVELFANPGVDSIYRRFGFIDEFHTHIFELSSKNNNEEKNVTILDNTVPQWLYELDRKAMGFDRSKLLNYLIKWKGCSIASFENKGFAIFDKDNVGPLIATKKEIAFSLLNMILLSGPKKFVAPERIIADLQIYSPKKIQSCLKMIYGNQIKSEYNWIWGYGAYATS
ncbi:MAG TPA: GNAT family N-acetyltransferase [candidate division Zixibacteria bacterium]|nr:GNAT family N-acetyltransferase [candidate division Zixibacteria bacterium]